MTLGLKLLLLLFVANGTPILLKKALGTRFACPVDGGLRFLDARPLLGPSKTWRGALVAVPVTGMVAVGLDLDFDLGLLIGATAMLGDLFSSFLKRRLGVPSSGMALGLDQVPEALFPLLAVRTELALGASSIGFLVLSFVVLELLLSRVLYVFKIREQPH